MLLKLLPPFFISLGLGVGLGCVPELNEHLHWNLWYIIPISGLIFGALAGGLGFLVGFPINLKINGLSLFIMAIGAAVGYAAIDYGYYLTAMVPISGVEGIPDGDYKLADIAPFSEFMSMRLGSSSVATQTGRDMFEMGAAGTTISYVMDLVGALLGSVGALLLCSQKHPFCDRCDKYKKREKKWAITFEYDEDTTTDIFVKIGELIEKTDYKGIVSYFRELSETIQNKKGDVRIAADQRFCTDCREVTILGNVFRKVKREWGEIDELRFEFTSEPGEHQPIGARLGNLEGQGAST